MRRMDPMTLLGLLIGFGGVLGGQILDGGSPLTLMQGTAFMIVIVGSFGAVLIATPRDDVVRGLRGIAQVVCPARNDVQRVRDQILQMATIARREGLLALEEHAVHADAFLVKCLSQAIDGNGAEAIRETVETDMAIEEHDALAGARFWENWGAICPTIGVLGAVLGLIHVMERLDTPAETGPGIAVAFVATLYGVGFANLVCLPLAFRMKRLVQLDQVRKSMILEGVLGIQSGMAPGALRNRLAVFAREQDKA